MPKLKKLSLATFETPTECRECPCVHITSRNLPNICQLTNRLIDPLTNPEPIPEWCPLKPVVFDEEYAK